MAGDPTILFGGLPCISAVMESSRGSAPGVCILRIAHDQDLSLYSAPLTLASDGISTVFNNCVPDITSVVSLNLQNRHREWRLIIRDRRQLWKGKTIGGKYNQRYRDNTVRTDTKKRLDELESLMLIAAGETSPSGSQVEVYPPAEWQETEVGPELDRLAGLCCRWVCRTWNDQFKIEASGTGDTIPGTAGITPDFQATIDGPKKIILACGPTLFQCYLELEAVGREIDGTIKPIDDLSYKPAAGWENEDPQFFAGVDINYRHLAFKTVFRMYRVKVQSVPGCSDSISKVEQFDLDDVLVSMSGTSGSKQEIPAFIKGVFYPYSDHFVNTGNCVHYSGDFMINKDSRCVELEYPCYSASSCTAQPTLYLITGFRVRKSDTGEFVHYTKAIERDSGTGQVTLYHPELWETAIVSFLDACVNSSVSKNTTAVNAEADVYLNAWKAHYDNRHIVDRRFPGIAPFGMTGNIAKLQWRVGGRTYPETRAASYEYTT